VLRALQLGALSALLALTATAPALADTAPALADTAPGPAVHATPSSQETLAANLNHGLAHVPDGWIASGTTALARFDAHLAPEVEIDQAIPPTWLGQGFDHIGDVDVAGAVLYVPFEQSDFERNVQVMSCTSTRTRSWPSTPGPASRTRWTVSAAVRSCGTTCAPGGAGSRR
jgi:hypothetical protein